MPTALHAHQLLFNFYHWKVFIFHLYNLWEMINFVSGKLSFFFLYVLNQQGYKDILNLEPKQSGV